MIAYCINTTGFIKVASPAKLGSENDVPEETRKVIDALPIGDDEKLIMLRALGRKLRLDAREAVRKRLRLRRQPRCSLVSNPTIIHA